MARSGTRAVSVVLVVMLSLVFLQPQRAFATTPALSVFKSVTVNGLGYSTTGQAQPGDTLTYAISVTNNTTAAIAGVVVTDTLQPGQSLIVYAGFPCTYTSASRLLTCPIGTIPGSATSTSTTRTVLVSTVVGTPTSATPNPITNTATATATGVLTATSNTTQVAMVGVPATPGTLTLCGKVTALTTTGASPSLTIANVTLPIAAGASITATTGFTFAVGADSCARITLNAAGQVTTLSAGVNAPGLPLICGAYSISSTAGSIGVGGIRIPVAAGANFMLGLTPGIGYCFLLSNGVAFAALSGVPTSIQPYRHSGYTFRHGFTRAE